MPSRPDLRDIATNVREAFADADREALLDILTFVLKEYVVEGPPPMLIHQAETLAELAGTSFAQLVTALQTRLDHPELAMFVVDGDQVGVRVGGVVHPITGQRTPPANELPRPAAGVRVVETTLQQRPAPPPSRGVSVRGAPAPTPPAPAAPPAAASDAAAPAPAPPASDKTDKTDKPETGDDASARFSLLELD
jgi:hypothetical protein